MFLRMIFRKLHFKENKYIMALVYGMAYAVFFYLVMFFSSLFLKKMNLQQNLILSLFVGLLMFVVYLIKEEVFKFK